jgi:hypothetical protein
MRKDPTRRHPISRQGSRSEQQFEIPADPKHQPCDVSAQGRPGQQIEYPLCFETFARVWTKVSHCFETSRAEALCARGCFPVCTPKLSLDGRPLELRPVPAMVCTGNCPPATKCACISAHCGLYHTGPRNVHHCTSLSYWGQGQSESKLTIN